MFRLFFWFSLSFLLFSSCKKDDASTHNIEEENFYALTVGNAWEYEVSRYNSISEEYELEYGTDKIEMHKDAVSEGEKVLIIDDLVATAGTCLATCNLIKKIGGKIIECGFVIELTDLKGREKLENAGYSVFSLVSFEGE